MAGLLTYSLTDSLPFQWKVAKYCRSYRDHSSGYCSGF